MRNFILVAGTAAITLGLVLAATALAKPRSETEVVDPGSKLQAASVRACVHPAGGWTTIDTDNTGSTASAALNEWTKYIIQCQDDTHVAWGDNTVTTDTSDGTLPADTWYEFITTSTVNYVAGRNVNSDSTCRIIECR